MTTQRQPFSGNDSLSSSSDTETTTSPSKSDDTTINGKLSIRRTMLADPRVQWTALFGFLAFLYLLLSTEQSDKSSLLRQQQDIYTTHTTTSDTSTEKSQNFIKPPALNDKKLVNPIKQITVLGERNSGTRWTVEHIEECFNYTLRVERRLTRHKHWFQYEDTSQYEQDTLVLAQFRNPYEWLKAMEHVPHHSPAHMRTRTDKPLEELQAMSTAGNDWKIFLTKEWTTERVGLDLEMKGDEICQGQERFPFQDIVSCAVEPLPDSAYNYTIRFSENQPFYEMRNDGSGKPYANIMEMRSDKILNHLDVKNFKGVADVWVLQYEYLLADGTQHLLDRIQEWTGIQPKCTAKDPQNRPPKKSRIINAELAKFVRENLNWQTEALIGYYPELKREEVVPQAPPQDEVSP